MAAQRGHSVTLFEADAEIGGQFNLAKRIPGKEEFHETVRYFREQVQSTGVDLKLNTRIDSTDLIAQGFDLVVVATGVVPRKLTIPGIDHPKVVHYQEVIRGERFVGQSVAIIGAGGIGFDTAEYLSHHASQDDAQKVFEREWGIDRAVGTRGGIGQPQWQTGGRNIYLLQRKSTKVGDGLGKTTGWIHRSRLKNKRVEMMSGVDYRLIDDQGLYLTVDDSREVLLPVDNVIVCAGQEPLRALADQLHAAGMSVHRIGGAFEAKELDAKRAIDQGARLAAQL